VNKAEMVEKLGQRVGLCAKDARTVGEAIFEPNPAVGLIAAELHAGGKVAISGFGTFETRQRKARQGRNPHTGQVIEIPATRAPAFKAGKPLKELLKG